MKKVVALLIVLVVATGLVTCNSYPKDRDWRRQDIAEQTEKIIIGDKITD